MSDWAAEAQRALADFYEVARLGGVELGPDDLVIERWAKAGGYHRADMGGLVG